jgi:hypothetical protein
MAGKPRGHAVGDSAMSKKSFTDRIREAQTADRQKHPYRQIYRRNRLTPEENRKANEGVLSFAILVFVVAICGLIFSMMFR